MPELSDDRNLLVAMMAFQLGMLDRSQLMEAINDWISDKSQALGAILVEKDLVTSDQRSRLESIVDHHVAIHGGNVRQSMASVPMAESTRESLRSMNDPQLHELADATAASPGDPPVSETISIGQGTSRGERFQILRPHARGGSLKERIRRVVGQPPAESTPRGTWLAGALVLMVCGALCLSVLGAEGMAETDPPTQENGQTDVTDDVHRAQSEGRGEDSAEVLSDTAWGKAVEGVQVRLTEAKRVLGRSDWPHPVLRLRYDAKNEGQYTLHFPENGLSHQVEVDGQWYEWVDPPLMTREKMRGGSFVSLSGGVLLDFESGRLHSRSEVEIAGSWYAIPNGKETRYAARGHSGGGFVTSKDDYGKELVLTPGRHQVRVAVVCPSARAAFHGVVRAVSDVFLVDLLMEVEAQSPKDGNPRAKKVIDPPFGTYVAPEAPVAAAALTFQGTVVDNKTGKPIAGASIEWGGHYATAEDRERTLTDARGRYVLRAAKSSLEHRLGVHAAGYAPQWLDLSLLDPTKSHIHDFKMAPGHRAFGLVGDREKRPIVGAIVTAQTVGSRGFFGRYSKSPTPVTGFPGPPRHVKTDATGRFEIVDLPDGQVQLSCSARHRYGRDGNYAVDEPVEFAMSGSGEPGVIQVRVVDAQSDQPIPAFRLTRRYDPTWYPVTNSDGQFRFPGEQTRDRPYSIYIYAKGYAPANASVSAVADNSDEFFTIRLTRAPAFVGQLIDAASGRPIAKARIMCAVAENASYFVWAAFDEYREHFHYGGLSWVQRAVTRDDGVFSFAEGGKASKGDLFILADGYQRTILRAPDRLKANPPKPVVVSLQPQSTLSGVLTRAGRPLPNVVIRIENPVIRSEGHLPKARRQLRQNIETARTDDEGRFHFEKLASGYFSVSAVSPSFRLERRIRVGSGDEAAVAFNADLGPHSLSGKAYPGAEITLGKKLKWGYCSFRTTADAAGNYRVKGLHAGDYSARLFRRATVNDAALDISYPPITIRGDEQRDMTQMPRKKPRRAADE